MFWEAFQAIRGYFVMIAQELFDLRFNVDGVDVSYGALIVTFIIITFFTSYFWKGARK